jgi:hypothetical protein
MRLARSMAGATYNGKISKNLRVGTGPGAVNIF